DVPGVLGRGEMGFCWKGLGIEPLSFFWVLISSIPGLWSREFPQTGSIPELPPLYTRKGPKRCEVRLSACGIRGGGQIAERTQECDIRLSDFYWTKTSTRSVQ